MPLLGTLPPFIQRRAIGTIRRGKGVTRAGIVEAAVILVEAEGLEALTMRRLGAEVGVEAMSLYNHVANKHDVIVAMADHVLSGVAALADTGNAWDDAMALGQAVRVALLQHPNTTRLFAMNMTLQASDSIGLDHDPRVQHPRPSRLGPGEGGPRLRRRAWFCHRPRAARTRSSGSRRPGCVALRPGLRLPPRHDGTSRRSHREVTTPSQQRPTASPSGGRWQCSRRRVLGRVTLGGNLTALSGEAIIQLAPPHHQPDRAEPSWHVTRFRR